ncbi:hypothetical protein ACFZDK_24725 [Streptomyces sp. NPDC007901]|uniref:hypothetical protein n=1 Tax=Streptomyces sp. NPDC007901 TaxID=3364785 RepID=UPI0036E8B251
MTQHQHASQPSLGDLRHAGVDLMVHRLWGEFEQGLSRTRRGPLALRLARCWARLTTRRR